MEAIIATNNQGVFKVIRACRRWETEVVKTRILTITRERKDFKATLPRAVNPSLVMRR
jgi:hypothetical protein